MLSHLENLILRELDNQNFKAEIISIVMDNLNDDASRNRFLSYMMDNRNAVLSVVELLSELKSIIE